MAERIGAFMDAMTLVGIRGKALELAVQQWCCPEAIDFNVVERAAYFEKYIREGLEESPRKE